MAATLHAYLNIHRYMKSADKFDTRDEELSKNGREKERGMRYTVLMKFMHRLHHDRIEKKRLRDLMIEISMAKSNFILQNEQKETWRSGNAHAYTWNM